jgi:O-antigen ligase
MTTPIFYWKGAEFQYLVFITLFLVTGLYITKFKIPIDKLSIMVVLWIIYVLTYRLIGYSTASFFVYAQIIFFWLAYLIFVYSDKYIDNTARKKIGAIGSVILLGNVIQNSIIMLIYPNASRQITKASIYYDKFRELNIGSTSFVFAACLLMFVFLGLTFKAKSKTRKSLYFLITIFLVYFQFQAARATSILLMILGVFLYLFLYYTKRINLIGKATIIVFSIPILLTIYFAIPDILVNLSEISSSTYLSNRLLGLANYINGTDDMGFVQGRFDVYLVSLKAFIHNPIFGIGEHDQFTQQISVGYHSEFLDIMGTYGIFGILFWVLFFWFYYKKIILRTKNKNDKIVLIVTAILFCTYALLNSVVAHDAIPVMIFLIIPFLFSPNRGVSINEFN